MRGPTSRLAKGVFINIQARSFSQSASFRVRHLMSIADLSRDEFAQLVRNAAKYKKAVKSGNTTKGLSTTLTGKTVAMMFSKRSTRTRVSTEGAVALMGGHPMFLGKDDIQLGVNESLYDTSKVISSMTSCMVARVGPHSDVTGLAKDSDVPVINALSNDFHPLQTIADFLTIYESAPGKASPGDLVPSGLKVAWVGDSNNVLFDLAIACVKMGVDISVASPKGYEIPLDMQNLIEAQADGITNPGKLTTTTEPAAAVKDADYLVTDTWISMGQEDESKKRLTDFEGFQITNAMASKGQAKDDWKFLHCLPRHPEEVADEVFYSERSLVFQEAENRLWAAVAALEAFVVNKGKIL
ncbi:putative Ornithine carbamoyltransferase [Seiridium unicorne]|uniref:Ornithine carbamoyltransferase, mitochondrial n=1 Tax=Seiridium unicorne TaxID=138068 RepID=A0ABR2VCY7_9PEZI